MTLDEVIEIVRYVHQKTGKKVGSTLLVKEGYKHVNSWIFARYPSFSEFAKKNNLEDICKVSIQWTDQLALEKLYKMRERYGGEFYDTDIRRDDRLLLEYIYKRSGDKSLSWFLNEYNIDFVKIRFANKPGRKRRRSAERKNKWTKEYIISELQRLHNEGHRLDAWYLQQNKLDDIISYACRFFGSYRDACIAAGFDYDNEIMRQKPAKLAMGDKFESIVKIIFDELYPHFIYQYKDYNLNIKPDWYDPDTNTIYDAKISIGGVRGMDKPHEYSKYANEYVVVYFNDKDTKIGYKLNNIRFVDVRTYLPMLSQQTRDIVESKLEELQKEFDECHKSA